MFTNCMFFLFQIIVLAKVIIDVDHITLSARGVTILADSLYSVHIPTLVLTGKKYLKKNHKVTNNQTKNQNKQQ